MVKKVVFVCVENAGRSQMAEAFADQLAGCGERFGRHACRHEHGERQRHERDIAWPIPRDRHQDAAQRAKQRADAETRRGAERLPAPAGEQRARGTAQAVGQAREQRLAARDFRGLVRETVAAARGAGVRYVDTAPFYGHGLSELAWQASISYANDRLQGVIERVLRIHEARQACGVGTGHKA